MSKIPRAESPGECAFWLHCRADNAVGEIALPEREFHFHPTRRYRFDFAWPAKKVALEVEGGTFSRKPGAHNRGAHFESDCYKYNAAVLLGWRVLRYTTDMIVDGTAIEEAKRALNA